MRSNSNPQPTYEFGGADARARLKELILYIAQRCESDPTFNSTKLNKILFWSDFGCYIQHGSPVTGVAYMRLPKGPGPKHLLPVRQEMVDDGEIIIRKIQKIDWTANKVIPLREPNLDLFTPQQISLVEQIIQECWGKTADEVSEASHGIAWRVVGDKDLIPYELAFLSDEPPTEED